MRWFRLLGIVLLLSACQLPIPAASQTSKMPRLVLTEKDAYIALPPEVIAEPMVKRTALSDDGSNLLALRERARFTAPPPAEPAIEISLILWDSRSRISTTVWKADRRGTELSEMAWMPQANTAFALARQEVSPPMPGGALTFRVTLLRIAPQFSRAQETDLTNGDDQFSLYVSPVQPFAVLHRTRFEPRAIVQPDGRTEQGPFPVTSFQIVRSNGRPGPVISWPKAIHFNSLEWTADGNPVVGGFETPAGEKNPRFRWYSLDTQKNQWMLLEKEPELYKKPSIAETLAAKLPLRLKASRATAQEGETTESIPMLWLESVQKTEQPRALLAADAQEGTLLPRAEGVLYKTQEALLFTPLLRMDRQVYELARRQSDRAVALNNGKQLGLALHMYAQDYDETLPNGDDIQGKLGPYLKNSSLFKGFEYTYGGGKLSDIANPAETILGHVLGPGGRAVLYADGHVTWQND